MRMVTAKEDVLGVKEDRNIARFKEINRVVRIYFLPIVTYFIVLKVVI